MNDHELERFEAELRGVAPASLPEQLRARLQAAKPGAESARRTQARPASGEPWWSGAWRWLAPVTALATVALLVSQSDPAPESSVKKQPPAVAPGFKADNVQLDEDLVSSFDIVATMPGGEPVRFHFREWRDELVATDTSHGVQIEQSNPRVEVVPVRFDTY